MKKQSLQKRILVAILTICGIMNAQAETLRGTVKDAVTGEALIGATVKILEADNAAAAGIIDGTPIYKKGEEFSERFDLGTRDVRNYESNISLPNIFYRLDF